MSSQRDGHVPVISVADHRLNHMFHRDAHKYATVSEYATAAGIDTTEVVDLLGPHLDNATLGLEVVGGEVFVTTAPFGRPAPSGAAHTNPNLWELLRGLGDAATAHQMWLLVRALERSGWRVEPRRAHMLDGRGVIVHAPFFGVTVGQQTVPVLAHVPSDQLLGAAGLLSEYQRAGFPAVAVTCDQGELDQYVTASRRWILAHTWPPQVAVLVLEGPRYQPVLLSGDDGAVQPVALHVLVDGGL